jgi:hypothetical protein|tara:strand:- start:7 stop:156 length:150 start_codon:yes stop_codon:yes gene_type:complete
VPFQGHHVSRKRGGVKNARRVFQKKTVHVSGFGARKVRGVFFFLNKLME